MRALLAGALAFALVACDDASFPQIHIQRRPVETPYAQQPLSAAWIRAEKIQLVLERTAGSVTEQRILLNNPTSLRGENVVLLLADRSSHAIETRFQPTQMLDETEGTPYPFEAFDKLSFKTREDSLGVMNWARWTNHAGLNCVLAFRRIDKTDRTLVSGAVIMDMMLRNCVIGSEDEALEPIGPDAVAFAATRAPRGAAPQMLSPLAAPLP
ncbi:hypothetical protein [Oceanicola sp. S124]|uniref:hypothetical protein n=1 Tax=Oceanicola sp. S124 TaxID=1042378 RepID=UPI00110FD2A0|nr:hypothetical protein [Oceanicola sp. S124]